VQRIWRKHGVRPRRIREFELSNGPRSVANLHKIVGLYVGPRTHHAIVLSIDDKKEIETLDHTQSGLPTKRATVAHCASL